MWINKGVRCDGALDDYTIEAPREFFFFLEKQKFWLFSLEKQKFQIPMETAQS